MKKLFQLALTTLLASGVALSSPVLANPTTADRLEASPPSLASDAAEEKAPLLEKEASDSDANSKPDIGFTCYEGLCFTLQHRFNEGEALPPETIEISGEKLEDNPLVILEEIRKNFSKHLKTQPRPVQIHTELAFLLPTDVTEVLGKFPKVSIKTQIQKDGSGTSDVVFPPYQRKIAKQFGEGFLDWKGLEGQFTFTDQFKTLTAALNMAGFKVKGKDDFTASLGKTTLNTTLGANWFPTQLKLDLPSFQSQEDKNHFNLQSVVVDFKTQKTTSGIDVVHINLTLGKVDLVDNGTTAYLDNLVMTTGGEEQDGLFNYTLQTQIGTLRLPPELSLGESLDVNYTGNINLRRLDAKALLTLQSLVQQAQLDSSMMMPLLMQLMAVAPQFLAQSPEIALSEWSIKTPKGNLQGDVQMNLDGQKIAELFDPQKWLAALQAQVAVTMDKTFLEHALASQVYYMMLQYMGTHGLTKDNQKELQQQAQIVGQEQIQKFVKMKWLAEADQNRYQLKANLKEHQLLLNGQEIDLPVGPK